MAPTTPVRDTPPCRTLLNRYGRIRTFTVRLAEPLSPEDCTVQSMPDASPTRWHLAHTTWFFETFILKKLPDYREFNADFGYLFNSYYNTIGPQFPRSRRGIITRPGQQEVLDYRRFVDEQIRDCLERDLLSPELLCALETGLHHEQQHQELILTDIKHALSCNPLLPAYHRGNCSDVAERGPEVSWREYPGGVYEIGYAGDQFCFDNERPRHRVFLEPFAIASRCVTNQEYIDFIEDGGYRRPELWLSLGWQELQRQNWEAPLYWHREGGQWYHFTLGGLQEVNPHAPVVHVSYFEADAMARWKGMRLPTEAEWEVAAAGCTTENGVFCDRLLERGEVIQPQATVSSRWHDNFLGNVWEWTASPYVAYPGYQPPSGALGEYNGKFMCNQFVLRGGSCATPSDHIRSTYRNFFPPEARWQFSGFRLAHDLT